MEDKILGHLRNLTKIKSIPFPLPPPARGGGRWWEVFVHMPELAKSGVL